MSGRSLTDTALSVEMANLAATGGDTDSRAQSWQRVAESHRYLATRLADERQKVLLLQAELAAAQDARVTARAAIRVALRHGGAVAEREIEAEIASLAAASPHPERNPDAQA